MLSQAAAFAGVSTELQRDRRRRASSKPRTGEGHTRFEFDDLCRMVVLKAFSDAGIRLKALKDSDFRDAASAAGVALMSMLAYGGDMRTTIRTARSADTPSWTVEERAGQALGRPRTVQGARGLDEPVVIIFDCKVYAERLRSKLGVVFDLLRDDPTLGSAGAAVPDLLHAWRLKGDRVRQAQDRVGMVGPKPPAEDAPNDTHTARQ